MKGSLIACDQFQGRDAAALLIDGVLQDLIIAPRADQLLPEAICRGIVGRPVKGLGGAFVELPGGQRGFLRQTRGIRPGEPLLVQVTGLADDGKAIPLSTRLSIKGQYVVLTPDAPGQNISRQIDTPEARARLDALVAKGMAGADGQLGVILRSAAEDAASETIAEELSRLRALTEATLSALRGPPELLLDAAAPCARAVRDWPAPDIHDETPGSFARHDLLEAIDALLDVQVPLPGGAHMAIEPTRALIAVDINTGADTSPAAALKANIAALRDLPRQLRLRGLGGQIVIDLAPCSKKDRQVIEQAVRAALRRDGRESVMAGWTPLGHLELTRKRDRPSLRQVLA